MKTDEVFYFFLLKPFSVQILRETVMSDINAFPDSGIFRFISSDAHFRLAVVISTPAARSICQKNGTYPLATMGLSRLVSGALLLSSHLDEGQEIGIHFKCSGPLGGLFVEAAFGGNVRGYCENPKATLNETHDFLDLKVGVGNGLVTVVRTLPNDLRPHTGTVPISTGEIATDLAYYLQQSHQIQSALALGSVLDSQGNLEQSGGVLLEILPNAPENVILKLETAVSQAKSLTEMLKEKLSPLGIAESFVGNFQLIQIEHPSNIKHVCRCSKLRILNALRLLGKIAIEDLLKDSDPIEVTCEFCQQKYYISHNDLRDLIR